VSEARRERKVVTVLFADLVGFTSRAESLDPEDVEAILTPYHARLRSELERHGGTVEKFIGDAVMALFGAPVAHEDDPERAVRAALAIRDWVADESELEVRIAVNTGEALVNLGARPESGEGMAAGDVVNTAARLQSAAPVNGILVGETTYHATRDAITYRDAPAVQAKGKAEEVPVWEAVEAVGRAGIDVSREPTTPLVGRDRELELLGSLLTRVREEQSAQLVTLVGVPGIGKSRLVSELYRMVDQDAELISWRQGRCLPYGESVTFWALGEIVKAEAGILETDDADEADRKLQQAVSTLVSDEMDARWLESELRALVGLKGAASSDSAQAAWRRFLEAMADRRPAVLVFEDLHWADDGLLDFVDDVVDWLRNAPLLVVGTARPELLERRSTWGGGKANASTLSLQPLTDADSVRLLSELLQRPVQLADEQQELLERAGGNPLFAEQYVRMLEERGTTGDLPQSVQGVIAARLDALPPTEKELLHEASVHGKVFWVGAVAEVSGVPRDQTEGDLRTLERKDFVRRERQSAVAGDTQYAFHHVLLRDVAYGQIPRRARADKHRRAAEWIEALGRIDDHAELLAYHYKQALDLGRAAGVEDDAALVERTRASLRAAGERALALSAYAAAAEFFAQAVELTATDDPERQRLMLLQGRALTPLDSKGYGFELLVEALDGFQAAGDLEGAAEAATAAARAAWFAGDRAATDRFIAVALEAVADQPSSRVRGDVLSNQSGFLMLAGRYEESIRVGTEALPLLEELGMDEQRARVHIVIGTARLGLGDPDGADEIERGIAVAEGVASLDMITTGYANLASGYHYLGRLEDARRAWRRELELGERAGIGRFIRDARAGGAEWEYLDGRWDEAVAAAGELIAASEGGKTHFTDASIYSMRAWIQLARGETAGADRDSRRAVELARASDAQAQAAAYAVRPAIAFALGARDEAEELASELVAMGPVLPSALCWPFPTLADVAWLFRDLGREEELRTAVLDATPVKSPWIEAAYAITEGDAVRAAEIIDGIGHTAAAAYTRLRSGTEAQVQAALEFYVRVNAMRFVHEGEALLAASA
jgi:class 3 adenylate cyclase/tetratricopeptide (TPR) repeat protein